MFNSVLPLPAMYNSWDKWANALLWKLQQPQEVTVPDMLIATVAELAAITPKEGTGPVYVSDETGGAVMAFGDGTNWRRCTDRAIVS